MDFSTTPLAPPRPRKARPSAVTADAALQAEVEALKALYIEAKATYPTSLLRRDRFGAWLQARKTSTVGQSWGTVDHPLAVWLRDEDFRDATVTRNGRQLDILFQRTMAERCQLSCFFWEWNLDTDLRDLSPRRNLAVNGHTVLKLLVDGGWRDQSILDTSVGRDPIPFGDSELAHFWAALARQQAAAANPR